MSRQICLSCIIDMPDDLFEAATATATLQAPWKAMLDALKASNVKHTARLESLETRAKPAANGTGAKRGRKPGSRNTPSLSPNADGAAIESPMHKQVDVA